MANIEQTNYISKRTNYVYVKKKLLNVCWVMWSRNFDCVIEHDFLFPSLKEVRLPSY